jgi:hypothetical protein
MNKMMLSIAGAGLACVLAGCGGVSDLTKERVARSTSVVEQSQQTVGNSEAGAIEMQRARELSEAAQNELRKNNADTAERFAAQAQLTAELAVAKAQSAQARRAADELMASIETLRQEAARSQTP